MSWVMELLRKPLRLSVPDDQYRKVAEGQKAYFRALAEKIEAGEGLDDIGRELAAGVLRAWAEQIPIEQKRRRGGAKIDHAQTAIEYAFLRDAGKTSNEAQKILAKRLGVASSTIRDAIRGRWKKK